MLIRPLLKAYNILKLGRSAPGPHADYCSSSVTNKVSKYVHLTVINCQKLPAFGGSGSHQGPQGGALNAHLTVI